MKSIVSLRYFVTGWLLKHFSHGNSAQTSLKSISFVISVALMPFTLFQPKISAVKLQKRAKIILTL